jgi:L-amino acid N-acyltransferase YncA
MPHAREPIMSRKVTLRDDTPVEIRSMQAGDQKRSFEFFQELPEEDKAFLRYDVSDPKLIERRLEDAMTGRVKRIVGVAGNRIIADAALELESSRWKKHVAEMRIIVARPYQRKGLGLLMARELYSIAAEEQVEQLVVKMMRPQIAARSIFRKLGFYEETLLPDYVKDVHGQKQDLILMRCDLEKLWAELEDFVTTWDWQRTR